MHNEPIKLTQYSHGAGCGCKLSPAVLENILKNNKSELHFKNLLVGNKDKDDAAVLSLGNGKALISTTDFFMPIVDDPYDFGRVAATNAISDIYAMGGEPILALAILGWPINLLNESVASLVVKGGQDVCHSLGIPLAGGHSIESPEPIFGLSVNGLVDESCIKANNGAKVGDLIFLTKPLGVGILTTAIKKNLLREHDRGLAEQWMLTPNKIGAALGKLPEVHALTDVTGFGLIGHLLEVCQGSKVGADLFLENVPLLTDFGYYLEKGSVPCGSKRNLTSFSAQLLHAPTDDRIYLYSDPQTSGGLLVCIDEKQLQKFSEICAQYGIADLIEKPIGKITAENIGKIVFR